MRDRIAERRHLAALGAVAGVALVLTLAISRVSLPSLLDHGWESIVPGSGHTHAHRAPVRVAGGASAAGVEEAAVHPEAHVTTAVHPGKGAAQPASRTGAAPKTDSPVAGKPAAPGRPRTRQPRSPASPSPPSTPPPGGGNAPGGGTGSGGEPAPAPSPPPAPPVSVNVSGGSVGVGVDTGDGTSASASVPVPSDPTQPQPPTVTTSVPLPPPPSVPGL